MTTSLAGSPSQTTDSHLRFLEEVRARTAGVSRLDGHRFGDVSIERASPGGLPLMGLLVGFERTVIVDAAYTGRQAVGTVTCQSLPHLPDPAAGHTSSAHDTSLATGRALGAVLPHDVEVVTVEIPPVFECSESLSPPVVVAAAVATEHTLTHSATRIDTRPGRRDAWYPLSYCAATSCSPRSSPSI